MKKILKRLSLYRNPLTEQFKEKGILHPEEISYLMEQGAKGWEILVSYLTTKRTLAASPEQTRKEILAVFITDLGWDNTEILFKKHLSPHSQVYLDVWKSLAKYEPSTDFLVKVLNTINIKAALEIIENSFEQGDPLTEILMDPDNDTIKSLVKKSGKLQIHSAENITRYKSIDILAIHDPQAALELIQKLPDFLQRKYFKDYNFDRPNLGRVIASGLLLSWWESLSDSRKKDEINVKPSLVYGLLGLVIAQGMLGMWTVTELLMPIIVSLHLLGGMTTLGLLTYISHRHWGTVSDKLISLNPTSIKIIRFSFVILFIQIFLGGWTSTNYAALACTDFPTCHGELIPPMDFSNGFSLWRELGVTSEGEALTLQALQAIQWVHRVGAFIFVSYFLYVIYLMSKFKSCNLYRNLLIIVIGFQFVIGVLNLLLHLPLALATMHNLGAALLVIITVIINSRITPKYD